MSIYIKGMEMPTNCCQCPVNMEICKRGYKYLLEHTELYDKRADDCPLISVLEHGRLIDADALIKTLGIGDLPIRLTYEIRHAPTIIPASEEGE